MLRVGQKASPAKTKRSNQTSADFTKQPSTFRRDRKARVASGKVRTKFENLNSPFKKQIIAAKSRSSSLSEGDKIAVTLGEGTIAHMNEKQDHIIAITDLGEGIPEPLAAPRAGSIPYTDNALEAKTEGGQSSSVYAGGGTGDLPSHLRSKTNVSP